MNIATALVIFLSLTSFANAAIVCQGKTATGNGIRISVDTETNTASVKLDDSHSPIIFKNLKSHWDGHMTGLITARGFSMQYQNHYGCFKMVKVVTAIRGDGIFGEAKFGSCKGGTTPDSLCFRE